MEGILQDDNEDLQSGDRSSLITKLAAYGESPVSLRGLKMGRMGKIRGVVLMLGRGRLVLRLRGMLVRKSGRLGVLVLVKFED